MVMMSLILIVVVLTLPYPIAPEQRTRRVASVVTIRLAAGVSLPYTGQAKA
jgi:hypothetical protein